MPMTNDVLPGDLLTIVRNLADIADDISMTYARRTTVAFATKQDNTPVTQADKDVEIALREHLKVLQPSVEVVGEEFNPVVPNTGTYWVIDPIDGTKNFIRGVPVWATLIAYVESGYPKFGIVSAPMLGRRWWGSKETGAFTSDVDTTERKIHVSDVNRLEDASLSYSDDSDWKQIGKAEQLHQLKALTWRQRAYGDFWSHMLVAEGSVDIAAEPKLAVWDVAALVPIVEGAGGMITGIHGESPLESHSAFTSNGTLHSQLLGIFRST